VWMVAGQGLATNVLVLPIQPSGPATPLCYSIRLDDVMPPAQSR
jgi:hypothetical protein